VRRAKEAVQHLATGPGAHIPGGLFAERFARRAYLATELASRARDPAGTPGLGSVSFPDVHLAVEGAVCHRDHIPAPIGPAHGTDLPFTLNSPHGASPPVDWKRRSNMLFPRWQQCGSNRHGK
jgi:hypothetical protein